MAPQTLSDEAVFVGLCLKIGTSQQVAIRRDLVDIGELFLRKVRRTDQIGDSMLSGSQKEGFRLKDSDRDVMFCPDTHRVLWDISKAMLYNTHRYKLLLCDSSESPPGYALLSFPFGETDKFLISSCVTINGALYISSAKLKDNIQRKFGRPNSKVHGPCNSGNIDGQKRYDFAHCFVSDFWPSLASSWRNRCHSWPPPRVVDNITRGGCHFVAKGHKLGKHADNEWRISFSQAEQKLVYAMNHTQFLTYGLLKLFVKEINNGLSEEDELLCSYHMKTVIFWAMQQNSKAYWCPQNFLSSFWICFKLLLKWVYEGVCPNFFIPEDNMFQNKVHGFAQRNLFTRLYGLYEKGSTFLLHISTISSCIVGVLCNPRLSVCTDEQTLISEVLLDIGLFIEINNNSIFNMIKDLNICMKYLHIVEQLKRSSLTECQIIMLQKLTATILQGSAFILHEMYTNTSGVNKHVYIADKKACYMLKLAAKCGFVSDLLYMAMYFYKTFRHREALSVIEMTKVKLAQPGLMYLAQPGLKYLDPERYTEAVGGQSWSHKMRHAVAQNIQLSNSICYINELKLEQQSGLQNRLLLLYIPPFILLHMLEFLCCRHVDPIRAQAALDDLQALVHQGVLVPEDLRDISWQILGICQQITGNHQAALFSYQQSLRQIQLNNIQNATRQRIQHLQ